MKTTYLNTDLVITSKADLSKIVEEFGKAVSVLHHGKIRGYQHAVFEVVRGRSEVNKAINSFCGLIEGLSKEARAIWDGCRSRVFDIGYEGGTSPATYESEIKAATLQRLAALNAGILITIYSGSEEVESIHE